MVAAVLARAGSFKVAATHVGSVTVDHEKVHELVDLAKDLKIKSLENMDKEEEIEVTPNKALKHIFLDLNFESYYFL